jgi:hypothetical protein
MSLAQLRLFPASFAGIAFEIEDDKDKSRVALDVKSFPRRDGASIDDHGTDAREIKVSAYIASLNGFGPVTESFRSRIMAARQGVLMLPFGIIPRVFLQSIERTFKKDKLGYAAFSLEFVVDDLDSAVPLFGAAGASVAAAFAQLEGLAVSLGISTQPARQALEATGAGAAAQAERLSFDALRAIQ